jgi:alkylhydroperoxidase family enzyme
VARLPYRGPEDADGRVREVIEAAPPLNIFRLMAHADTAFIPWLRWGGALLSELELDPVLREIAILHVARLTPGAEYEWVQHEAIAIAVGVTAEQVSALERDEPAADCFSERERGILRFVGEVVAGARVAAGTYAGVANVLSPREIVELLMVVGQYMMVGRVMAALEIDPDDPLGATALGAARNAEGLHD